MRRNKKILYFIFILSGILIGYGLRDMSVQDAANTNTTDQSNDVSNEYPFIAKRTLINNPNDPLINFTGLRLQLKTYMLENSLKGSLYFEYLPTGTNVRVDDDSQEAAASLMKIPAVMELYKAYELGRIDLDTPYPLEESWLDSRFGELYKQGAGYMLSLREAMRFALNDSDNTAINMIIALSRDLLAPTENVLTFLDVDFLRPDADKLTISARSYSSFLKCLYFSCYLNVANSNEILEELTQTKFSNRLRAGVPPEIQIAHKIGTFSNSVMSDCGIIYEPKRPYVLCFMLEVADDQDNDNHFSVISKITYDFVQSSSIAN